MPWIIGQLLINKMQLNPKKTKDMWICFRNDIEPPSPLILGNSTIERVTSFKLLGIWHQNGTSTSKKLPKRQIKGSIS